MLRKSVRLKISPLNSSAAFLRIFFLCLYASSNEILVKSIYSKIYLKEPTKL